MHSPLIIFTDLDATLLDHETYAFDEAAPMLDFIKRSEIPLVFVTSKTAPEAIALQDRIGICAPFIVENGGALFIPRCCDLIEHCHDEEFEIITLGEAYDRCVTMLHTLESRFPLRGFSHMSHDEVVELTGLEAEAAQMARERHCSEPFILDDPADFEAIRDAAEQEGFTVTKGGRFYHLISQTQSKGNAVRTLLKRAHAVTGTTFRSIALGDSENDFSMLEAVDQPVLIPKPGGEYAPLSLPRLIRAPYPGPKGWNAALQEILHDA